LDKNGSACDAIRPPHVLSRRPLSLPAWPPLPARGSGAGLGAAVGQGNGAGSQCGVAGRRRGTGLARRRRLLPVRPARREPRRGGAVLAACRDAAALPLATVAALRCRCVGRVGGGGGDRAVDPRRGGGARARSGAFPGEEEPAGAAVAELTVQGRHLLQEDRTMGVAHLVSASSVSLGDYCPNPLQALIRAYYTLCNNISFFRPIRQGLREAGLLG
jgi:hypothetical protein